MSDKQNKIEEFNLHGELAILVHCARLNLSLKRRESIKAIIGNGIDWEILLKNATWHRITPLIFHHLRTPDFRQLIPDDVFARLQHIYFKCLAKNIRFQDEIKRILSTFNREGIPVVLLKGSALLDVIYHDIGLRPMSDLDLLVKPEHLDRAESLVLGLGYSYEDYPSNSSSGVIKKHLPKLIHKKNIMVVELHRHIVDSDAPGFFDITDFIARAQPVYIKNEQAFVLAPEDLIAHLSVKFLSDRRFQSISALGQLCDISEIINYYDNTLDWDLLVRVSHEKGIATPLFFIMYACQRTLATSIPPIYMQKLWPIHFNPDIADTFIRRRVLNTNMWLAHGLVDTKVSYNKQVLLRSIARRLLSLTLETLKNKGNNNKTWLPPLSRLKNLVLRLIRGLSKPSEFKEDLLLDRWLHDIFGQI